MAKQEEQDNHTLQSWWYFGTKKIKCLIDPKILDPDIPEYIREVYDWEGER
jgi:hypothetical protein